MKVFTDRQNRKWELSLTVGSAKRVRDILNVSLLEPEGGDPPLLTRIATDVILLCNILYVLCKKQADGFGVSEEDFGELLGGEVLFKASEAFYQELIDFFQKCGRTDRATAVQKQVEVIDLTVKTAELRISQIDPAAAVETEFGSKFTGLPDQSESIQNP